MVSGGAVIAIYFLFSYVGDDANIYLMGWVYALRETFYIVLQLA